MAFVVGGGDGLAERVLAACTTQPRHLGGFALRSVRTGSPGRRRFRPVAPDGADGRGAPPLQTVSLTKTFGGNVALDQVDFSLGRAEIRALVGQNGSGRSTLIKLISGFHRPDGGEIRLHGQAVQLPVTVPALREHGVGFVHQDLGLVESLSVVENMKLGRFRTSGGRIRWQRERDDARRLLATYGLDVDPAVAVGRLSHTERTIVALVRALDQIEGVEAGIVVLDEPTSALPAREIGTLFEAIRRVRDAGHSVILVTHHLDEVFAVADTVTIFRAGRAVGTEPVGSFDNQSLTEAMIGGKLEPLSSHSAKPASRTVLSARGLSGRVCRGVDLEAREGEILGLTGLLGAGHEEVPYLVYGAEPLGAGELHIEGVVVGRPSPVRSRRAGLALLPSDRHHDSGIMTATVAENVSLPAVGMFRRVWGIDGRAERSAVEALLRRFDVRPARGDLPLAALSGGNQQKALLGRWIEQDPKVLLLDEPSNGVDVGARQAIFATIQDCARAGMTVVVASSQYDDICAVCTRALIFSRGRVVSEVAGSDLSPDRLLSECYRAEASPVAGGLLTG